MDDEFRILFIWYIWFVAVEISVFAYKKLHHLLLYTIPTRWRIHLFLYRIMHVVRVLNAISILYTNTLYMYCK